ncbi:MAG TPA: class I SAM-dependent methyltransferase [Cyclobacteriaceae bacterium]|nr:class I SAM-dependent methyltransferase [Cyclobacteriaceae bacterium]
MQILFPTYWKDYELIDSGNFEKLERFGQYLLIRPEPQAIWQPAMDRTEWLKRAHANFDREQKDKFRFSDDVKGGWNITKQMSENWEVNYQYNCLNINLRLGLTSFGHVGIFPEQGENWNFIHDTLRELNVPKPKVLNLFAYTGAASIVAAKSGATVTHCDASRPGLNWANQNMQLNGLDGIRWVHEDALKFIRRESKRGNKYNGIIMDPPPYGRGPDGEKWTLQEKLDEIVGLAQTILEPGAGFFILSMYAAGLSGMVGLNVVKTHFHEVDMQWGEFALKSYNSRNLPMGTFVRFVS